MSQTLIGPKRTLLQTEPRKLQRPDAVTVLSVYVVLLLAIPSNRGIGPLGGAGNPSTIFSMLMLLWWMWHNIRRLRPHEFRRLQPVRIALFCFILCVLVSYVIACLTALPAIDGSASNLALINIASYAGVVLVASDGIPSRERFLVLVRRIGLIGGIYATLGLVQFFTGQNFVDSFSIPGLSATDSGGIDTRGGFLRPEATARHALEYAAVLSMTLPLALTMSIHKNGGGLVGRWFSTAAILLASFMSVTRSALLGTVAVLLVLIPSWEKRVRRRALWAAVVGLGALYFLVPGLGGTILGMFSGTASDPSVSSRADSFGLVGGYVEISPLFGRGLGTLSPEYRIFDNQFIDLLIETGVIGTISFFVLTITAMTITFLRRRSPDYVIGALGPALSAAVLSGTLLCAFFDAFHFPQAVGMLFLMIGLCGAHWNIGQGTPAALEDPVIHGHSRRETTGARRVGGAIKRRWYVSVLILLLAVPVVGVARSVPGVYYASYNINFQSPPGATKDNALRTEPTSIVGFVAVIQRLYESGHPNASVRPTQAPLYGTGLRDAQAVYLPSAGGQWQTNFNSPTITVEIVKHSAAEVTRTAASITSDVERSAMETQTHLGVVDHARITTQSQSENLPIGYISARHKYAFLGIALIFSGLSIAGAIVVDRLIRQTRRLSGRDSRKSGATKATHSKKAH